jgi:hypothetical protein
LLLTPDPEPVLWYPKNRASRHEKPDMSVHGALLTAPEDEMTSPSMEHVRKDGVEDGAVGAGG